MALDEYGRPTQYGAGIGAGPREIALYMAQSKVADTAPVIPKHTVLLGMVNPPVIGQQ